MTPALTITRRSTAPQTKVAIAKAKDIPQKATVDAETPSLTLDVAEVARELKTSTKNIQRMHMEGKFPAPIVIGSRSLRWSRETLVRWIAAGGPPRDEFERLTIK